MVVLNIGYNTRSVLFFVRDYLSYNYLNYDMFRKSAPEQAI